MALPPVPSIYFDADEILATEGKCLKTNLDAHAKEVCKAKPCTSRSLRTVARVMMLSGLAVLSGYLLTVHALPILV